MKFFLLIILIFIFQSCTDDINEFIKHKKAMDELFGPCEWKYVGKDSQIDNPAITLIPPNGQEYVLWNQNCTKN